MTHLLYQLACNPKLPLETRYRIARYLQAQRKEKRKKERRHDKYGRYQRNLLRREA